jgi:hypothetical protein
MTEEKREKSVTSLGLPDLQIADLQIWIQGRQFPDSSDYWDGNWLYCTLHCGSPDSDVWLRKDPFIHVPELQRFYRSLTDFLHSKSGTARLETMEDNLTLTLEAANSQDIRMDVFITPNAPVEDHHYALNVSHEQVEELLRQLNDILRHYPIKGQP